MASLSFLWLQRISLGVPAAHRSILLSGWERTAGPELSAGLATVVRKGPAHKRSVWRGSLRERIQYIWEIPLLQALPPLPMLLPRAAKRLLAIPILTASGMMAATGAQGSCRNIDKQRNQPDSGEAHAAIRNQQVTRPLPPDPRLAAAWIATARRRIRRAAGPPGQCGTPPGTHRPAGPHRRDSPGSDPAGFHRGRPPRPGVCDPVNAGGWLASSGRPRRQPVGPPAGTPTRAPRHSAGVPHRHRASGRPL